MDDTRLQKSTPLSGDQPHPKHSMDNACTKSNFFITCQKFSLITIKSRLPAQMGCSLEDHQVAVGLFVGILLKVLTKKKQRSQQKEWKDCKFTGLLHSLQWQHYSSYCWWQVLSQLSPWKNVADSTSNASVSSLTNTTNSTMNNSQQ